MGLKPTAGDLQRQALQVCAKHAGKNIFQGGTDPWGFDVRAAHSAFQSILP